MAAAGRAAARLGNGLRLSAHNCEKKGVRRASGRRRGAPAAGDFCPALRPVNGLDETSRLLSTVYRVERVRGGTHACRAA